MLPGNRIVMETQGWNTGLISQGQARKIENRQFLMFTQKLWGIQAILSIPQSFSEITGTIDKPKFSIQSIAAEVNNPPGTPTPKVIIDNGNSNDLIDKLGTASTYNPKGGGALFQRLDADNVPLILQSFPTSNLQPLLEAGSLARGTIIPQQFLEQIGFFWGNPLTGTKNSFQPQITSLPGIKVGQGDKFDNLQLLNILINPFINEKQRDSYYLNSLFWVPLGQRLTNIAQKEKQEISNWQRLYFSRSHNRTLLQYDPIKAQATYTNVFSSPGFSLSLSINEQKIDNLQTANTTLGMLMGGIFDFIHPPQLEASLQEAKKHFLQQDDFADLNLPATPQEISKINQLLNRTLLLGNRNSSLEQISGTYTFPSKITPDSSSILQIRTGNYRRGIEFVEGNRTWIGGKTFISKADLSNKTFGPLTFIGVPVPLENTSIRSSNRSSAVQVSLVDSQGKNVENWNLGDMTELPMSIRSFTLAFDHLELSQIGQLMTKLKTFNGYLSLPTVEFLWAAASGNWNYGFNSGIWLNLNADSAFNVSSNDLGLREPTIGVYTNATLSYINTRVKLDDTGKVQTITSHIPSLSFHWNSQTNIQNPAYLNLSYSFFRYHPHLNYFLVPSVILFESNGRFNIAVFLQGKLSLATGLDLTTYLEIDDNISYKIEGLQKLNQNWSLGGYWQNFTEINQGLETRTNNLSYGLLIKHNSVDSPTFWESRIGINGDSFGVRLEGGWRF